MDDALHRLFLVDRAQARTRATTVTLDTKVCSDEADLHRPTEERVGHQPRGRSGGLPGIEVFLLELTERDAVIREPVQEVDRDGDRLLAALERALRDLVHLVHPALVLPADVAADHVAVDGIYEPVVRVSG